MTEEESRELDRLIAPLIKFRQAARLAERLDRNDSNSRHENNNSHGDVDDNDFLG